MEPTGIVDSDFHLPFERFLHILDRLVDLFARIDVALERLDTNAVFPADLLGDRGSVGRGVGDGDISSSCVIKGRVEFQVRV